MLLSEIAEKIIKKESNLSLENEVIVGNREEWYEESLIDPLIDYYSYDVLRLCGCGCPNDTLDVIRKYLHIRKDWKDNKCDYDEVQQRYKTELNIDDQDDIQWGLLQFMAYILDDRGFTEHGSSIGGCWLTEKKEFIGYVGEYSDTWLFETDKTPYSSIVVLAIDELLRTETKDCEKYKITIEKLEAEMI